MDNQHQPQHGFSCCRRQFITTLGMGASSLAFHPLPARSADSNETAPSQKEPAKIMGAFIYPPSDQLHGKWWSWPGNDFDAEQRPRDYLSHINEMAERLNIITSCFMGITPGAFINSRGCMGLRC